MDYLIQLWEDWNDQWGAGVAGLAALILVIIALTEKLRGFVSSVRHWKGWIRIGRQYELLRDRYRVHIAKRVMRSKLAELGGGCDFPSKLMAVVCLKIRGIHAGTLRAR